jgi:hypothetical protein
MIAQWRAVSTVLGRRETLKYLGLGLLAAATAACSPDPDDAAGTSAPEATGAPAAARPSAAALAVEAFAKGTWKVTSTVTRGNKAGVASAVLTVADGTWSIGPGLIFESFGATGEYTLSGGVLKVVLRGTEEYRRKYPQVKDQVFTGEGVPKTVPNASFILGWATGTEQQTCDTQWDGTTLTIAAGDFHDNSVLLTATRT